jgi:hypothetical protein
MLLDTAQVEKSELVARKIAHVRRLLSHVYREVPDISVSRLLLFLGQSSHKIATKPAESAESVVLAPEYSVQLQLEIRGDDNKSLRITIIAFYTTPPPD